MRKKSVDFILPFESSGTTYIPIFFFFKITHDQTALYT